MSNKALTSAPRVSLNCAVLTISDTRNASNDTSGDYLENSLLTAGHRCRERAISTGNIYELRRIVSNWVADPDIQVVLSNGGTGFAHRQCAFVAISPLLDMTLSGFGELFRHLSFLEIGTSTLQSDAFAGTANNTLVFCMPGSSNACKTAWEGIIKEQLDSTHRPCNFGTHYHA